MGVLEIVSSVLAILALIVFLIKRKFSHWKNMGIPYEDPVFPYGNIKGIGREFHIITIMSRLYHKLKSLETPFVGIFFFFSPVVLVTSLDFVKTVLVKDASYFTDRGQYYNEDDGKYNKEVVKVETIIKNY